MSIDPDVLAEQGKAAFAGGKYAHAADLFRQSVQGFETAGNVLMAAEMQNNCSVALLKADDFQGALDAAKGTDKVFGKANDIKRQAMSFGNQAAAYEALKQYDQALSAYERSAELFGKVGETEMRSMVQQSAAAIKLRKGKLVGAAFSMLDAADSAPKPTFWQRVLKFLLRFIK